MAGYVAPHPALDHPKGNVDFHMSPHQAAAQEALEEAGVVGGIGRKPLGVFHYDKVTVRGAKIKAKVVVFPLAVTTELDEWLEMAERERRWYPQAEAAEAVQEPDLADLIRSFKGRSEDS